MRYITLCILLFISTAGWANTDSKADINHVLDELHAQAAAANFDKYFAVYTSDAIFIGTDAEEVWSIHAFKAYAKPYFDQGKGWTYHPRNRHIYLSENQQIAWFDELLDNVNLGETRGMGVLVNENGQWKVAQYHLAIPIPNALADDIASQIKAHQR